MASIHQYIRQLYFSELKALLIKQGKRQEPARRYEGDEQATYGDGRIDRRNKFVPAE